eukprot:gene15750-17339_t
MFKKLKQRIEENDAAPCSTNTPTATTAARTAKKAAKPPLRQATHNYRNNERQIIKKENKWEKRYASSSASLYSSIESINSNVTVSRADHFPSIFSSPETTPIEASTSSLLSEFNNGISREKVILELDKRSEHIKKLEKKISEMASAFAEQAVQKENLEDALQTMKQEIKGRVETTERKYQHKISLAKEELEQSMRKKDSEFEDIIKRKDEEIMKHRRELSLESSRNVDVHDLNQLQQDEISRMKEMLIHSQAEMTKKAAELFEKTKYLESVDKQYMEQRTELDELQNRLDDLARERSKYELRERQLSLKMTTAEKERDALKSQLDDALCELSEKSNQLEIAQVSLKRAQEDTTSLRDTYKLYKLKAMEEKEKFTTDSDGLKERIQDLEQRLKDGALSTTDQWKAYEKEATAMCVNLGILQRELYESRLQEARSQLAENKARANDKINTLGSLISSLDEQLKERTEEVNRYKKSVDDKDIDHKAKFKSLEEQLRERDEELNQYKRISDHQSTDYERKIEFLQEKLRTFEDTAQRDRESDATKISTLQQQIADLGGRLHDAKGDSIELKTAIERADFLEAKNKLLDSRLKEANKKVDDERLKSEGNVQELQRKIQLMSYQFEQSSKMNVETLETKIEEQDRRILQYQETTQELLEDKERLKEEILLLSSCDDSNLRFTEELQQKIAELEGTVQDRDAELHEIKIQLNNSSNKMQSSSVEDSNEIGELQVANRALLAELEGAKKKIKSQQQKLAELKKACQRELSMKGESSCNEGGEQQINKQQSQQNEPSSKDNQSPTHNVQSRQLIGVISHLLQFTTREEHIVKECMEWKFWSALSDAPMPCHAINRCRIPTREAVRDPENDKSLQAR